MTTENMGYAETAVLLATRDRLRTVNTWDATVCEIEFEEMTPATVGRKYIAVMPGGWRPGPRHNTSGGVSDLIFAVDVAVIRRIGDVPRDRRRNTAFIDNLSSLNALIDLVYPVIHFNPDLMNLASQYVGVQTTSIEPFIEMMKFAGMDKKPRIVPGELFGGSKDTAAGMMRVLRFDGMRRITTIN